MGVGYEKLSQEVLSFLECRFENSASTGDVESRRASCPPEPVADTC